MRSFGIGHIPERRAVLLLNGKPYKHLGVLDQGYIADGIYTPASDQLYVDDIPSFEGSWFPYAKKAYQDRAATLLLSLRRLGILVWQDLVNGGPTL